MKAVTQQIKDEAFNRLPLPLQDFLGSEALVAIYKGLATKLQLNFRQIFAVSEITNLTILGIEQESALETNIHLLLPELSNKKTRELVADINDRIFKEARRRLQENVIEPKNTPLPKDRMPTDAEYEELARQAKRTGIIPEAERRRIEEEELERRRLEREKLQASQPAPVVPPTSPAASVTVGALPAKESTSAASRPSIALEKMKAPNLSGSAAVSTDVPMTEAQPPSARAAATEEPIEQAKTYESGIDPYREKPL